MEISRRHLLFSLSMLLSLLLFNSPLRQLAGFAVHHDIYSYIPLIPVVSGVLVYWNRKSIFHNCEFSFAAGAIIIGIGSLLFIAGFLRIAHLNENDYLSLLIFSVWLAWLGTFVLFYGFQTFKRSSFPLLFLLFMIPIPDIATQAFEHFLQKGSAEVVAIIFYALGLPVIREGFAFHFPQLSVEIWENCAGIRVGVVLVITAVIAANLLLRKRWTITLAVLSSVPIAILRNALRIVSLSVIGVYFDEGIFKSNLHNIQGGILFFSLALFLLWAVITLLKRFEKNTP